MEDLIEFINFIEFAEEPTPRRYLRDLENPLEFFSDLEFYKRYRFSKETVVDVLLGLVSNIDYSTKRGLPIPKILQLLTALRFYASSNFQIVSGDIRGINQATVTRIIKRVSMVIASQFKDYINLPNTAEECRSMQDQFYKMYKMPGIGGCIHCTHIKIQNPGGPDGEVFQKDIFLLTAHITAINSNFPEWYFDSASVNFLLIRYTNFGASPSLSRCDNIAPIPTELASVCTSVEKAF